jgi:flagellin-like hook-associated protein FlgL
MMRADIATMNQGIRNTADAISMIQTADGALGVIDEKLVRMKELAEQAATGTYTTAQREIINSEYQAMAAEIDRIANATNFNGIKLLDGSVTNQHGGQGLKIHFGVSNKSSEDYYFVNIGDARATSSTGLRVGGDAKNDIWGQGAAGSGPLAGPGCCTAGYSTLNEKAGFIDGETFSYGYNWDWQQNDDAALLSGRYLAGRYTVSSSESLQNLIDKVNQGSQSRVGVQIDAAGAGAITNGGTVAVCVGDEAYYWGDETAALGKSTTAKNLNFAGTADLGHAAWTNPASSPPSPGNPTPVTYLVTTAQKALFDQIKAGPGAGTTIAPSSDILLTGTGVGIDAASAIDQVNEDIKKQALPRFNNVDIADVAAKTVAAAVTANTVLSATESFDKWLADSNNAYFGQMKSTLGTSYTFGTGVYSNDGTYWTSDSKVAANFGWSEIKVTLTGDGTRSLQELFTDTGQTSWDTAMTNKATEVKVVSSYNTSSINPLGTGDIASTGAAPDSVSKTPGMIDSSKKAIQVGTASNAATKFTATSLAEAINQNANSQFWAMTASENSKGEKADMVYIFAKEGGNLNTLLACDVSAGDTNSRSALNYVLFENVERAATNQSGTTFTLGGQKWGTMTPTQTKANLGNEVWNVTLNGRDVGDQRDLWIAAAGELTTPGLTAGIINGMDRFSFVEIQNAANGPWAGAEVRTQSSAQEALDAMSEAINTKDKIRADLGALQNRLQNTMTNMTIQAENLQAAESRISDVDVAKEMTEFTRNNVLAQAATGMLAQANSLSQLALSLLG